jgi:tight adherence protein B
MNLLHNDIVLKYGGLVLLGLGLGSTAYLTFAKDTIFTRYYRKYTGYLDRNLKLLFMPGSPDKIAAGQLIAAVFVAVAGILLDLPIWYLFEVLVVIGPSVYLAQKRSEYIKKLESQVDTLILGLANSLKTVPGPAAALAALEPILPVPTKLEVGRILKEIRIGSTLDQAVLNMSVRLKSPAMDSALSALLIGLQVGGNLPRVLESTAATIREMNRLDGVVKTKTSEGRAQLWVLALFPFAICLAFNAVQEGYFDPLQKSFTGYLITAAAIGFWMAALLVARKVLRVDI